MGIINDIRNIIEESRQNAVRSVDFCRVQMYGKLAEESLRRSKEENDGLSMVKA